MAGTNRLMEGGGGQTRWYGNGHQRGFARSESEGQGSGQYERLASFLGWFSVGLGLTQVLAPRELARFIGVRDDDENQGLMRVLGLRELAAGVGILTRRRPVGWLWGRVAGDAMDLALLGRAMTSSEADPNRVMAATAAVAGVTALDLYASVQLSRHADEAKWPRGVVVRQQITVDRPAEELYQFWHDFENLPRFMTHLESVQVMGDRRSHWKAKAPAGRSVGWDAEIIDDRPNERIAWRSLPGADVENSGSVQFTPAPGGRGTEIRVELRYSPPAGALGALIAKLFGEEPNQQIYDDLRAFKMIIETGEVIRSDATVGGGRFFQHSAQPVAALAGR